MKNIIFIHGYLSSGKGFKGKFLKKIFPQILTPNFKGYLDKRMKKLEAILKGEDNWIIIGSSYGGLMGSLYACKYPEKVKKLILLAPYIISNDIDPNNLKNVPIDIPVIAYHGIKDKTVNLDKARSRAEKLFSNLSYNAVDDDHGLDKTMYDIKWKELLEKE
ncbi:MAG: alpha/beta hydrolase [Promethearchaeota archaeon]